MRESYSGRDAPAGNRPTTGGSVAEPVPALGASDARALLAQLLPEADPDLLVTALLAERESGSTRRPATGTELPAPERELRRVRSQVALGEAARMLRHSLNNPLTALLAEAQLLELEPLTEEQGAAVARIVQLARRLVAVARQLEAP